MYEFDQKQYVEAINFIVKQRWKFIMSLMK